MQKITPFLWFDGQAEKAMNFYVSIFKNSKTGRISRYGDAGPGPKRPCPRPSSSAGRSSLR
jgi:predicted 3-demethylubiquinone-9 3-methyltransferase (glyoxalase superfamily)